MAVLARVRLLLLVGCGAVFGISAALPQSRAESEYELKAAVLYRFLSFAEWPSYLLTPHSRDSIRICILGDDPFGDILDRTIEGKTVDEWPLTVRRGNTLRDFELCHVVFISSSEDDRLPQVLRALQELTALTVGDMDGFAEAGGMIGLRLENNRISFTVNIDAVRASELTLSSRLLRLATIVTDDSVGREP